MLDFLKLAKRKLKKWGPKNQSPTFSPGPQIDKSAKAQPESVQPLSTAELAVVGQETSPNLDILDASRETNPLLAEAKKRYKEATGSMDEVLQLYAAKKPDARFKAKGFETIVQVVLDGANTKAPKLPVPLAVALSKLIPLMKLALGLTQNVADVFSSIFTSF